MKYLVKDITNNNTVFISGETKKEIIIKALQKYLTEDWTSNFMQDLDDNYELTFIDITNIEEL